MVICLFLFCRSMHALWGYLRKKGIDTSRVWETMVDLIIKTIIRYGNSSVVNQTIIYRT